MNSETARYIQDGIAAIAAKESDKALSYFDAAIDAARPTERVMLAEVRRRRGQLYFDLGRLHDAISDLTAALTIDPSDREALKTRALVRLALKNPRDAVNDAEAAVKLDENDATAYQILGMAQRRAGRIDAAIASLTRAARLYLNLGEDDKSRQCLAHIDRLKPRPVIAASESATTVRSPTDFYREAIERAEAGDAKGALADLEWALQGTGEPDAAALCCRGAIYSTLGKFKEALSDFNRVLRADAPLTLAYGGRGRARLRLDDVTGAIADLTKAIELDDRNDDRNADLFVSRGAAYRHAGNDSAALTDFERALAIDAACGRAYLERGMLYARQEELAKAAADYQQAASHFCERGAWDDYQAALDKAAKLRQPASIPETDREAPPEDDEVALKQKLVRLVGGHRAIADRLIESAREQIPGMTPLWYLQTVIAKLETDGLN